MVFVLPRFWLLIEKLSIFVYMDEKLIKWLRDKKNYLKIRSIEEELGIPQSTLNKYLTGHADNMPDKWKEKVIEWVKNFKKG